MGDRESARTDLETGAVAVPVVGGTQQPNEQPKRRPPRGWLAGLAFILLVATGASLLELCAGASDEPADCPDTYTARSVPAKAASKPTAAIPIDADGGVATDPELTFAFGASRGAEIRTQAFRIPGDSRRQAQNFGFIVDLVDDDTGEAIPPAAVRGQLRPVSIAKRVVRFRLCIDPSPADHPEVEPGTYTGSVLVGSPAARPEQVASVPVEVTVSDDDRWIAMLAVLIGVIAGLVVRASADLTQAPGKEDETPPGFHDYLYSLRFLVMLAGGLLAGALVYGPLFADKADATTDLFDALLPLAGASFTATLAAKTLADLRSPTPAEREAGIGGLPLAGRRRRRHDD